MSSRHFRATHWNPILEFTQTVEYFNSLLDPFEGGGWHPLNLGDPNKLILGLLSGRGRPLF